MTFENRKLLALAIFFAVAHEPPVFARANSISSGSKAETENYVTEIAPVGAYKAGAEGLAKITLVAKGAYHINDKYPYKFKTPTPPPEGLTYPKPVLARADGAFEATRATFQLPFVAAKTGKATVGGTLFLSVCSEANCLVEKVPLEIAVEIK